jgi:rubrerythrin
MDHELDFNQVATLEQQAVIRNLQTAFEEELRTSSACRGFASRAESEGLHGVASVFRATARAEDIHAGNHARVLRHMGASTQIDLPEPHVESTHENLKAMLVEQKFEVDYLYPTFLTSAVPLFDSMAIRSFHWALEADKSHVRLYGEVSARVNANGHSGWAYARRQVFVCALCGYAALTLDGQNCPACNFLWEKCESVS